MAKINTANILQLVKIPGNQAAQDILNLYKEKGQNASELERINLAIELCHSWDRKRVLFSLPAVPQKNDYWYLVQLYFLDRHVHQNGDIYKFNVGTSENVYIEKFDAKASENGCGFLLKELKISTLYISRDELDAKLAKYGNSVLSSLGFDSNEFKIAPIPYDILLRLPNNVMRNFSFTNIFFEGYRKRSDGQIRALYGGNKSFGGCSFIDSIWMDIINRSIYPMLVIISKTYGY